MCHVQAPEMVRVPLEELVLQIHLLGLGPAGQFLERVLEPPPKASVEGALAQLQALGALTPQQQLTPLGTSAHICLRASWPCFALFRVMPDCVCKLQALGCKACAAVILSALKPTWTRRIYHHAT